MLDGELLTPEESATIEAPEVAEATEISKEVAAQASETLGEIEE